MYPTNLTDSQYEVIKGILNDQRKRKYELRTIINAILYISKGGVQWRLLPKDFPSWQEYQIAAQTKIDLCTKGCSCAARDFGIFNPDLQIGHFPINRDRLYGVIRGITMNYQH